MLFGPLQSSVSSVPLSASCQVKKTGRNEIWRRTVDSIEVGKDGRRMGRTLLFTLLEEFQGSG